MRCFVLFLTSAFLLGKLFSLNGIWAAYTLAEVLSFAVYIIATQAERAKLKKQGTDVNFLLLDKKAEESFLTKNTKVMATAHNRAQMGRPRP